MDIYNKLPPELQYYVFKELHVHAHVLHDKMNRARDEYNNHVSIVWLFPFRFPKLYQFYG